MSNPWVMENNCVKYYPDQTRSKGVMAEHGFGYVCTVTLNLEI